MSELQNAEQSKETSEFLNFLCLESSCDDTSVAVLRAKRSDQIPELLSLAVQSQDEVHRDFGGIVPELASRQHLRNLIPCFQKALSESGKSLDEMDFFAATAKPGLVGSLLIGHTAAKTLSFLFQKPLVSCDHLESHLLSVYLESQPRLPSLSLLVSGGHTSLYRLDDLDQIRLLGVTRDDAAGEAFDKAAKLLGLGFPGGPQLESLASESKEQLDLFPEVSVPALDFSFSGLKSDLARRVTAWAGSKADLACSFQKAIVDHLCAKVKRAYHENPDVQSLCVVGGVARNRYLKTRLEEVAASLHLTQTHFPSALYCTDNAAMIGVQAFLKFKKADFSDLQSDVASTTRPALKKRKNAS